MKYSFINPRKIAILMATYNGEKYIEEQLQSIQNQTFEDWTLYIRDDGSTDNTLQICHEIASSDNRIIIIEEDKKENLGAANNFLRLLSIIESDYYMFSDQDDVWKNNKIEISFHACLENEKQGLPIVVHSDSTLVDSFLNIIVDSYWNAINLDPDKLKTYYYLALSSYAQGATMLFNCYARKRSLPLPTYKVMHDWWVSTRTIKNQGLIISIKQPTILYRQHGENVIGVRWGEKAKIKSRLKKINEVLKSSNNLYRLIRADGYGSISKFIFYKFKLTWMLHR